MSILYHTITNSYPASTIKIGMISFIVEGGAWLPGTLDAILINMML